MLGHRPREEAAAYINAHSDEALVLVNDITGKGLEKIEPTVELAGSHRRRNILEE